MEENVIEVANTTDLEQGSQLKFSSIDARHLSSYPLISQRVVKLLRASKNHMHASKDMLTVLVQIGSNSQHILLTYLSGIFRSLQNRHTVLQDENQ